MHECVRIDEILVDTLPKSVFVEEWGKGIQGFLENPNVIFMIPLGFH